MQLSQSPSLRTVNVSHTLLWDPEYDQEPQGKPSWVPICECMTKDVVDGLTRLRQVAPRINWVLDYMSCRDEQELRDRVCPQ